MRAPQRTNRIGDCTADLSTVHSIPMLHRLGKAVLRILSGKGSEVVVTQGGRKMRIKCLAGSNQVLCCFWLPALFPYQTSKLPHWVAGPPLLLMSTYTVLSLRPPSLSIFCSTAPYAVLPYESFGFARTPVPNTYSVDNHQGVAIR